MKSSESISVFVCLYFALTTAQDLYEGDVCKNVRGRVWTCKRLQYCKKAIQIIQSGGRPQLCGFYRDEPIACCEPDDKGISMMPVTSRTTTTYGTTRRKPPRQKTTTSRPLKNGQKSYQMCRKYAEYVFLTVSGWEGDQKIDTCNQLDALIVGGQDAKPREFPHMAQIGYGEEQNIKWRCGGSLISKDFILSAAHCTEVYKVPAGWVRLGEYNIKTKTDEVSGDAQPVVFRISERINHPGYKNPYSENDIALYKLETDVTFNEFVRPICLHTEKIIKQTYASAIGWGNTEFGGKASDVLQKVNLTLNSHRECSSFYQPNSETLPNGIQEDSMFCAGDTFSNKDTCQGDSGGPLQVLHPEQYCMYSLVGVTSFGRSCASQPGVYTRVSHFVPWIESVVWQ